tara:strand:+ start:7973 stop:8104 length:132 start_codon:yes stop_codon:yes gene_type:complete
MKLIRKILGISKWVTVTSVTEVRENNIRYMEIYENGKTSLIAL